MERRSRAVPRRRGKASTEQQPQLPQSGGQDVPAIRDIRGPYLEWARSRSPLAFEGLQRAAGSGNSAAACLALAKAHVLRVASDAIKKDGRCGEPEAMRGLIDALRYAVRGALRHNSLHCLVLGAQLLQAAAGRPLLADERMQLAVNLLLKEEQHDTAAAHGRLRAAAAAGGGGEVEVSGQGGWFDALPPAQWAPPEQETLPEDRWPFEFQGGAGWEAWAAAAIRSLHQMLSQSMSREATVFMVPEVQVDAQQPAAATDPAVVPADSMSLLQRLADAGALLPPADLAQLRRAVARAGAVDERKIAQLMLSQRLDDDLQAPAGAGGMGLGVSGACASPGGLGFGAGAPAGALRALDYTSARSGAPTKLGARKDRRRKQQEINAALQDAFNRAQVIRKYLSQQVARNQEDPAAALQAATATSLYELSAALDEAWQDMQQEELARAALDEALQDMQQEELAELQAEFDCLVLNHPVAYRLPYPWPPSDALCTDISEFEEQMWEEVQGDGAADPLQQLSSLGERVEALRRLTRLLARNETTLLHEDGRALNVRAQMEEGVKFPDTSGPVPFTLYPRDVAESLGVGASSPRGACAPRNGSAGASRDSAAQRRPAGAAAGGQSESDDEGEEGWSIGSGGSSSGVESPRSKHLRNVEEAGAAAGAFSEAFGGGEGGLTQADLAELDRLLGLHDLEDLLRRTPRGGGGRAGGAAGAPPAPSLARRLPERVRGVLEAAIQRHRAARVPSLPAPASAQSQYRTRLHKYVADSEKLTLYLEALFDQLPPRHAAPAIPPAYCKSEGLKEAYDAVQRWVRPALLGRAALSMLWHAAAQDRPPPAPLVERLHACWGPGGAGGRAGVEELAEALHPVLSLGLTRPSGAPALRQRAEQAVRELVGRVLRDPGHPSLPLDCAEAFLSAVCWGGLGEGEREAEGPQAAAFKYKEGLVRDVFAGLGLLQQRLRLPAGLMDCVEGFVAHHLDRAGQEAPDHSELRDEITVLEHNLALAKQQAAKFAQDHARSGVEREAAQRGAAGQAPLSGDQQAERFEALFREAHATICASSDWAKVEECRRQCVAKKDLLRHLVAAGVVSMAGYLPLPALRLLHAATCLQVHRSFTALADMGDELARVVAERSTEGELAWDAELDEDGAGAFGGPASGHRRAPAALAPAQEQQLLRCLQAAQQAQQATGSVDSASSCGAAGANGAGASGASTPDLALQAPAAPASRLARSSAGAAGAGSGSSSDGDEGYATPSPSYEQMLEGASLRVAGHQLRALQRRWHELAGGAGADAGAAEQGQQALADSRASHLGTYRAAVDELVAGFAVKTTRLRPRGPQGVVSAFEAGASAFEVEDAEGWGRREGDECDARIRDVRQVLALGSAAEAIAMQGDSLTEKSQKVLTAMVHITSRESEADRPAPPDTRNELSQAAHYMQLYLYNCEGLAAAGEALLLGLELARRQRGAERARQHVEELERRLVLDGPPPGAAREAQRHIAKVRADVEALAGVEPELKSRLDGLIEDAGRGQEEYLRAAHPWAGHLTDVLRYAHEGAGAQSEGSPLQRWQAAVRSLMPVGDALQAAVARLQSVAQRMHALKEEACLQALRMLGAARCECCTLLPLEGLLRFQLCRVLAPRWAHELQQQQEKESEEIARALLQEEEARGGEAAGAAGALGGAGAKKGGKKKKKKSKGGSAGGAGAAGSLSVPIPGPVSVPSSQPQAAPADLVATRHGAQAGIPLGVEGGVAAGQGEAADGEAGEQEPLSRHLLNALVPGGPVNAAHADGGSADGLANSSNGRAGLQRLRESRCVGGGCAAAAAAGAAALPSEGSSNGSSWDVRKASTPANAAAASRGASRGGGGRGGGRDKEGAEQAQQAVQAAQAQQQLSVRSGDPEVPRWGNPGAPAPRAQRAEQPPAPRQAQQQGEGGAAAVPPREAQQAQQEHSIAAQLAAAARLGLTGDEDYLDPSMLEQSTADEAGFQPVVPSRAASSQGELPPPGPPVAPAAAPAAPSPTAGGWGTVGGTARPASAGSAGGSAAAAAARPAPARAGSASSAGRALRKGPDPTKPRIVGWNGDWVCGCGNQYSVRANCRSCGIVAPCRDYLRGACPSAKLCKFPHPPFAMSTPTPPAALAGRSNVLCVDPEAVQRAQQAQEGRHDLRVISWFGDWACSCGEENLFRDVQCHRCKTSAPCREWVRGRCRLAHCRYPHAPFDLPRNKPPNERRDSVVVNLNQSNTLIYEPSAAGTTPAGAGAGGSAAASGAGGAKPSAPPSPQPAVLVVKRADPKTVVVISQGGSAASGAPAAPAGAPAKAPGGAAGTAAVPAPRQSSGLEAPAAAGGAPPAAPAALQPSSMASAAAPQAATQAAVARAAPQEVPAALAPLASSGSLFASSATAPTSGGETPPAGALPSAGGHRDSPPPFSLFGPSPSAAAVGGLGLFPALQLPPSFSIASSLGSAGAELAPQWQSAELAPLQAVDLEALHSPVPAWQAPAPSGGPAAPAARALGPTAQGAGGAPGSGSVLLGPLGPSSPWGPPANGPSALGLGFGAGAATAVAAGQTVGSLGLGSTLGAAPLHSQTDSGPFASSAATPAAQPSALGSLPQQHFPPAPQQHGGPQHGHHLGQHAQQQYQGQYLHGSGSGYLGTSPLSASLASPIGSMQLGAHYLHSPYHQHHSLQPHEQQQQHEPLDIDEDGDFSHLLEMMGVSGEDDEERSPGPPPPPPPPRATHSTAGGLPQAFAPFASAGNSVAGGGMYGGSMGSAQHSGQHSVGSSGSGGGGWRDALLQTQQAQQQQQQQAVGFQGASSDTAALNGFISVVLHCLWHCADFRGQVLSWPPYLHQPDPVLSSLHGIFLQLAQQGGPHAELAKHGGAPAPRPAVDAEPLREALARLPGRALRLGEPGDVVELLSAVYERVNATGRGLRSAGLAAAASFDLEAVFGLALHAYVYCEDCMMRTHDSRYVDYFHKTQAAGLRLLRLAHGSAVRFGGLLRLLADQALQSCDPQGGGCDARVPAVHVLERAPRVFTLQLAWGSQQEEAGDIAATLAALDERVDLAALYEGLLPGQHVYRLRSLVCHAGGPQRCCCAFVLLPELGVWVLLEGGGKASRVGSWAELRRKCEAGRIQPSVLFYEAPH
ncbi:hypothetical protein N2152v2_008143 [Parachlorella kessleri]